MPLEHADLDPLREDITQALASSTRAEDAARQALDISRSTADQVLDLRHSQQRTEASLNTHRTKSEERHAELLAAIGGAASTDAKQAEAILAIKTEGTKQAEQLAAIKGDVSNSAIGKIVGGVVLVLGAVATAITLVATQLAPVLPSVVQARYGQPVIVYTTPSAAPASSR